MLAMSSHPYEPEATNVQVLRYIVAVADAASFRQAARRCFVTQPTLSAAIAQWEKRTGALLFERSRRGVRVTDVGEQVVQAARRILHDIAHLESLAAAANAPFFGPIRLGIIPTIGPYLLPFMHAAMRQAFPDDVMHVYEDTTAQLLADLQETRIDCACLAVLDSMPSGLEISDLFDENFIAAVPADHDLAQQQALAVDELTKERLLLLADGHCLRDQALAVCGLASAVEDGMNYRATSLETLRQMVAAGHGITLLPALAASQSQENISYVPLAQRSFRRLALVWRAGDQRADGFRALGAATMQQVPPDLL